MRKILKKSQCGYTLVELLIVVAIIGLISLVGIPNFIVMFRGAKMRTALQNFSGDIRSARQTAITKNVRTRLSFTPGTTVNRDYFLERQVTNQTDGSTSWVRDNTGSRKLEETVYFSSTTFDDIDPTPDGLDDIVFLPNGTIDGLPTPTATVTLKTDQKVSNPTRTYTFTLGGSFRIN